jgi:polysaccharide biosynthesis/export protein
MIPGPWRIRGFVTIFSCLLPRSPAAPMWKRITAIFLLLAWAHAGVDAHAQQGYRPEGAAMGGGDITLAPGDALHIAIWREQDLSGEFLVDEEGMVTLPLLGRKNVLGLPIAELRAELMREYAVQLRNPSIQITPLRRIYVLGEVNRPGLYAVDPTISLAGAVALAMGATPMGDLNRIRIIREGEILHQQMAAQSTVATLRSGDQVMVDRRGWIERNSTFVISLLLSTPGMILSILTLLDAVRN